MKRYFKHKLENLIVVNKIVMLYYFEFNKNYKHEKESHDFWEIVYAKKSDLVCTADGKEIILKEGEMLFHKPNETHSLSTDGVSAPDVFVILFECRSKAMRFFENKVIPLQKKQRYRSIPIVFVGILLYFRGGTAVPSAKDCSPHSKGQQYLRQGTEEVIESIQKTVYFKDIC